MSEVRADNKIQPSIQVYKVLTLMAMVLGIALGVLGSKVYTTLKGSHDANTIEVSDVTAVDGTIDQQYVKDILDIFQEKYLEDFSSIDSKTLTYGAVKGMIQSLDDPYTSFLDPTEAEAYLDQRGGDFEGIGVTLTFDQGYSTVESVLKGYPAETAGLTSKDIILEVDGSDMKDKTPTEVATKIRGTAGTQVKLKIYRTTNDQSETLDFTITREKINVDNVTWKDLENGLVEINIVQFTDDSIEKFNSSWDKVVAEIVASNPNPKGIVVDLRNNPGGFVQSVQHVMEEFLTNGTVMMQEQDKTQNPVVYKDTRTGEFENIPVVVLVNEGSASASEIFSAAIQQNNRGSVVGMPTVGKGVEQQQIQLSDGSILMIVFQEWLTPNGTEITKENPITPDYSADLTTEDFKAGRDPQLDKAKELLK